MQLAAIKTDRLYLKVSAQISNLVATGAIKAGERLPAERELAEKLDVSRATIREAMIALEIAGVVEIRKGSGVYITNHKATPLLTDEGVGPFEILQTRYIVESEACALAATKITSSQLSELRRLILDMQEEEKKQDASEKADMKFHVIIAKASQNSALLAIIKWLWELRNQSNLSQVFMSRLRKSGIHPSINEHKNIVSALEQGSSELAKKAMQQHIQNATEAAATYFNAN